jgi:hypothetical protein
VLGDALGHEPLDVRELLGLDGDVGGLALEPARGLVHHDPGVGQRVALALGAGAQQELAHRGGEAHADGGHVGADEVHRVVDGHAGRDRATGELMYSQMSFSSSWPSR